MNSEMPSGETTGEEKPGGGFAAGDALFILFRHKFLILGSLLLGLLAVMAVRFLKPPNYESTAQIYLPFVVDIPAMNPNDPETALTRIGNPQMQMLTEVELLKSFDTAQIVVNAIGAEKILADYGGGSNRLAASGVIASGVSVNPPQSTSLTVTFSHRNRKLVQPIMQALMDAYMQRHKKLRVGDINEFATKSDEAAGKLKEIEEKISKLKSKAGVTDLRQRRETVDRDANELQGQIVRLKVELSRRQAELGEFSQGMTNLQANPIPSETITTYSDVMTQIEDLKRRRRVMALEDVTTNHPAMRKLEVKIQEQLREKASLEQQYPTLTNYVGALMRAGNSNDAPRFDLETELGNVRRLKWTIAAQETQLRDLTKEAFGLMDSERELAELERQRDASRNEYKYYANAVERVKMEDSGSGKAVNMKLMQSPTPPAINKKKLLKMMGAAFGGCVGLGVGIAFLIDMVLDRFIRRPSQVVRILGMPTVLTIPDTNRIEAGFFPWRKPNKSLKITRPDKRPKDENTAGALAVWSPDNQLQSHIEGLRERVITYFEVRNPIQETKLVAVTASSKGAGASTLANGLAASLSRTGNGSVLLVDMNTGEGVTHSFYKGKLGYGPAEPIQKEPNQDEPSGDSFALSKITIEKASQDRLSNMLPPDINGHLPRVNGDLYDYIVFDMTTISPASVTPRMSGRMDLVLFVIESEKTKDHVARSAYALLRASRANVMAVLNKYYNPVPEWLSHD